MACGSDTCGSDLVEQTREDARLARAEKWRSTVNRRRKAEKAFLRAESSMEIRMTAVGLDTVLLEEEAARKKYIDFVLHLAAHALDGPCLCDQGTISIDCPVHGRAQTP